MVRRDSYLRVKAHLQYLREVEQIQAVSADRYWFYLRHLLLWLDDQPLDQADRIRPTFPVYVSQLTGKNGMDSLAIDSQKTALECARRFFRWAKQEYGRELQSLPQSWTETLRVAPSAPETMQEHSYVTEDCINQLMRISIPAGDLALQRDRAAAAMLFLSGARAAAFTTLPIKAVRLRDLCIDQFPSLGVRTKNGQAATTFLLQLPDLLAVVQEWDRMVRASLLDSSPWYPVILSSWGEQELTNQPPGRNRAGGLDRRLKRLFGLAGLPYRSAHRFRHGHAIYALLRAKTPADFRAISMNLMHSSTHVTDAIYSFLSAGEVRQRILALTSSSADNPTTDIDEVIRQSIRDALHSEVEAFGKLLR